MAPSARDTDSSPLTCRSSVPVSVDRGRSLWTRVRTGCHVAHRAVRRVPSRPPGALSLDSSNSRTRRIVRGFVRESGTTSCSRLSPHVSRRGLRIGPFSRSAAPSVEERRDPGGHAHGCRAALRRQRRGCVCVCVGGRLACVHTQTCERVRTWPSAPRAGTLELPRASPALIRHHAGRSRLLSLPLCHVPSTERRLRPPSPSLAWLSSSRASAPWWRRSGEPAPGEATWQVAHRPFASAPLAPLISQAGCSSVAGHHPLRWRCFAISSPPPSSQPICDLHTIRCSLVL